jgi:hypothetical protein
MSSTRKSGGVDDLLSLESLSVSGKQRQPLPKWLQKVLAEDIESNGGVQAFKGRDNQKLANLLDSKASDEDNPYGVRGDPIRKRIGQKVYKWSLLTNPEWEETLKKKLGGVKSHATRMREGRTNRNQDQEDDSDSSGKSSSSESDPRVITSNQRNPPRRQGRQAPSSPPSVVSVQRPPSSQKSSGKKNPQQATMSSAEKGRGKRMCMLIVHFLGIFLTSQCVL